MWIRASEIQGGEAVRETCTTEVYHTRARSGSIESNDAGGNSIDDLARLKCIITHMVSLVSSQIGKCLLKWNATVVFHPTGQISASPMQTMVTESLRRPTV